MHPGALLYIIAGGSVLIGQGPLAAPGILCAAVCAILAMKKKYFAAAGLGFLAAAFSYTMQACTTICPACLISAALFMFGSLAISPKDVRSFAFLVFPVMASGLLYVHTQIAPYVHHSRVETAAATTAGPDTTGAADGDIAGNMDNKKDLYFSPYCRSCPDALRETIARDPEGRTWRPVVVPESSILEGKEKLRELGYKSENCSAAGGSPSGGVPCLVDGDVIITGSKNIKKHLGGG